jgi:hypothetical protein
MNCIVPGYMRLMESVFQGLLILQVLCCVKNEVQYGTIRVCTRTIAVGHIKLKNMDVAVPFGLREWIHVRNLCGCR